MDTFCFGRLPLKYSYHATVIWLGIWGLVLIALGIFLGLSDGKHTYVLFYVIANNPYLFIIFFFLTTFICGGETEDGFDTDF